MSSDRAISGPSGVLTEQAPQGRVDRRVQEFRAHVLETAESLFAERGVEATKIDDICIEADVAKRTLCNHFPTKAHIVQALSRDAVSRMVVMIDDARTSGASARERVSLLFTSMFEGEVPRGPIQRESVGAFFHVAHGTPDAADSEIRVSDAILLLLQEGGADELPAGCSAETFAEVILGAIYSTTLEWIHRNDYDVETRTAEVGRFIVSLLPEPAALD